MILRRCVSLDLNVKELLDYFGKKYAVLNKPDLGLNFDVLFNRKIRTSAFI